MESLSSGSSSDERRSDVNAGDGERPGLACGECQLGNDFGGAIRGVVPKARVQVTKCVGDSPEDEYGSF